MVPEITNSEVSDLIMYTYYISLINQSLSSVDTSLGDADAILSSVIHLIS